MTYINVEFTIDSKIIDKEYEVLENRQFSKNRKSLDFTSEEYAEYLNIILNKTIRKSGGKATIPFHFEESPISNSLSIAFQAIGQVIDNNRDIVFVPVSKYSEFTMSEDKFLVIRSALQSAHNELAIVNKVPGPRSSELKEVMSSRVESGMIIAINESISPNAIVICSLVQPNPDKIVAYSKQQHVDTEVLAYLDKLARV